MVLSALLALLLQNAFQLFNLLLVFGAGTGLIFILRWFWWRINAWSEITAMFASGIISIIFAIPSIDNLLFNTTHGLFPNWAKYILVVLITTIVWLSATFLTKPESETVLQRFYKKTQPGGPGWQKIINNAKNQDIEIVVDKNGWSLPSGIIAMLLGCCLIYSAIFATGYWVYGQTTKAIVVTCFSIISGLLLAKTWSKIKATVL